MKPNSKNKKTNKTIAPPNQSPTLTNNSSKWVWYILTGILFTTFLIYVKAIQFDFLTSWDDNVYIKENNTITALGWENIKQFWTQFYAGNYQPITILSYAIEYKFAGLSASLYHFDNIVLHLINTYLVFVLIRKLAPKNVITALLTATLFAVHPMHVESVAWISERKDVLYSFFLLTALIAYLNYREQNKIKYLFLSGVLFILSCLSKSAAVIFPLLILLLDYYSDRKYEWSIFIEKIPFFAISLIFGIIALKSQNSAIQDMSIISWFDRISLVSYAFSSYILKAFVPFNLSAIYPYPVELGSTLPFKYYFSIFAVIIILIFVWYSLKWSKDILFGFLFFVITIILVLQFVPVGGAMMADRYTYIPYIGLFFIAGKYFEKLAIENNLKYILAAIVFVIFSASCYSRVKIWKTDKTLFTDVINKYPYCTIAHFNRGCYELNYNAKILFANNVVKRESSLKNAIKDFDATYEFDKNYKGIYFNRGCAKYHLLDYKGALVDFDKAIPENPMDANTYFNRSNCKKELNDFAGAMADLDKSIELNPKLIDAYNNRSILKCLLKDYHGTIADYDKMIELNPGDTTTIKNREIIKSLIKN